MSKGLGKEALHLTIAKVITICITLATNMLLARFRTLEEYGTYSQITMVISLGSSFFMFGLPNCINYFLALAETSDERKKFLSFYYTLTTILGIIVGTVLLLLVPIIEAYFDNDLISKFAYFIAIYPWASITIAGISNVMVVYGKTVRLLVINIVTAVVAFFSVLVIQIIGLNFSEYMVLFLCGNVAISIWIYYQVFKLENGIYFFLNKELFKKVFVYSIPLGLATLLGTLSLEVDKLMIGGLMNTEALAVYSNAGRELPLTFVATSLTAVLLPRMARCLKKGENKKSVEMWGDTIVLSYIIISFFVMICLVFAPQIITVLYSEKYILGTQVFRIYSLTLLLRTTYFGMILNSIGKTKYILISSFIALGINAALNIVFFKLIGFEGPAIATALSLVISATIQILLTSKAINIKIVNMFPWTTLGLITLLNIIIGFVLYIIIRLCGLGITNNDIIICIIICVVIFLGYIFLLKKRIKTTWKRINRE